MLCPVRIFLALVVFDRWESVAILNQVSDDVVENFATVLATIAEFQVALNETIDLVFDFVMARLCGFSLSSHCRVYFLGFF